MTRSIVEVRGRASLVSAALRAYATERLLRALGRFSRLVRRVRVFLADINGPRRGADKRCRVVLGLADGGELVLERTAPDAYAAVHEAAHRVREAVARSAGRRRASYGGCGRVG